MEDETYEEVQEFLNKVRAAYREAIVDMDDAQRSHFVYKAQDSLSLFSPWMNAEESQHGN